MLLVGIRCTASLPGFTATEIFETSRWANHDRLLYSAALMSPTTVARQAYHAVMQGRPTVIHGVHHRALAVALLHAPLPLRRRLANALADGIEPNA